MVFGGSHRRNDDRRIITASHGGVAAEYVNELHIHGVLTTLDDAVLPVTRVLEEIDLGPNLGQFVGRGWLRSHIEAFIAENASGWFVIEGEAGIGKTAFIADLVTRWGAVHHYCSLPSGGDARTALRSLTAQLMLKMGYEGNDLLPDDAGIPESFDHVLRRAAEHAAGTHDPLVIAVDSIESATALAGMPLGLPVRLPLGVFVVLTRRIGGGALPLEGHVGRTQLLSGDPRNMTDMRLRLEAIAGSAEITEMLAKTQMSQEWFVDALMTRCDGVWIYLKYVELELRLGLRNIANIDDLPVGLWAYYAESLAKTRVQRPDLWYKSVLPLLATLGLIRERVALSFISDYSSTNRPFVAGLLNGSWRPFLSTTQGRWDSASQVQLYAPYHATFADFATGQPEGIKDDDLRVDAGLLEELREAAGVARGRLVERMIRNWGGYENGLPGIPRRAADIITGTNGYVWRHLAHHVLEAEGAAALSDLLVLTRREGDAFINVLYTSHALADDLAGYVADLELAMSALFLEKETEWDLTDPETAARIVAALKLALIASSVRQSSAVLPASLLARMVQLGVYSTPQLLTLIRRLPIYERLNPLIALACVEGGVPPPAQVRMAVFFVEVLGYAPNPYNQYEPLEGAQLDHKSEVRQELVRMLPTHDRELWNAYPDAVPFFEWVAAVFAAPILTADECEQLIQEAMAHMLRPGAPAELLMLKAVITLMSRLPPHRAESLVDSLLQATIRSFGSDDEWDETRDDDFDDFDETSDDEDEADSRILMEPLLVILPDGERRREIFQRVLQRASGGEDYALAFLSQLTTKATETELSEIEQMVHGWTTLDEPQALLVTNLATNLNAAPAADLLTIIPRVSDEIARSYCLASLATVVRDEEFGTVIDLARSLNGEWALAAVLAGISSTPPSNPFTDDDATKTPQLTAPLQGMHLTIRGLATSAPDEYLPDLETLLDRIEDVRARGLALQALMPRMDRGAAEKRADHHMSHVLSLPSSNDSISDGHPFGNYLQNDIGDASDKGRIMVMEEYFVDELERVAPYLSSAMIERLAETSESFPPERRWSMAAILLPHASSSLRQRFSAEFLSGADRAYIRGGDDGPEKVDSKAAGRAIPYLNRPDLENLVESAIQQEYIENIIDGIAAALPAPQLSDAIVRRFGNRPFWESTGVLEPAVQYLDEDGCRRLESSLIKIHDGKAFARYVRNVAPYLSAKAIERLKSAAISGDFVGRSLPEDYVAEMVLGAIAPVESPEERASSCQAIIESLIDNDHFRLPMYEWSEEYDLHPLTQIVDLLDELQVSRVVTAMLSYVRGLCQEKHISRRQQPRSAARLSKIFTSFAAKLSGADADKIYEMIVAANPTPGRSSRLPLGEAEEILTAIVCRISNDNRRSLIARTDSWSPLDRAALCIHAMTCDEENFEVAELLAALLTARVNPQHVYDLAKELSPNMSRRDIDAFLSQSSHGSPGEQAVFKAIIPDLGYEQREKVVSLARDGHIGGGAFGTLLKNLSADVRGVLVREILAGDRPGFLNDHETILQTLPYLHQDAKNRVLEAAPREKRYFELIAELIGPDELLRRFGVSELTLDAIRNEIHMAEDFARTVLPFMGNITDYMYREGIIDMLTDLAPVFQNNGFVLFDELTDALLNVEVSWP